MIKTKNINFSYSNKTILTNINLAIKEGDVISLLGPNGSGKSTLIKVILGLLKPKSGEVLLDGKNLQEYTPKELAKTIAYVPQSSYLPFSFTVLDIVIMGRIAYQTIFSKYSNNDKDIAEQCLQKLGILDLKDKMYNELSGGQKQLVLISRALAQEAKVFVMDEPVSGLDYGNQLRLLETIKNLSTQGYTFLKSTHYPDHAFLVSNKVVLIKNGTIFDSGSPENMVTEENIKKLYDVEVNIDKTSYGHNICIPKFTKGKLT